MGRWHSSPLRVTSVLAVLLLAALVPVPPASGDTLAEQPAKLPWGRWGAAAAWPGTLVFVLGGQGQPGAGDDANDLGFTDEILAFDPAAKTLEFARMRLPTARAYAAAVSDGKALWLFGGLGCATAECPKGVALKDIVRIDPANRTATVVGTLPKASYGLAAAVDGRHVYLFGGTTGTEPSWDILRFDTRGGAVQKLPERLPSPRAFASAVWADGHAFVFGGEGKTRCTVSPCIGREVLLVEPDRHAVTLLDVRLPRAVSRSQAALLGDSALLFAPGTAKEERVFRFDVVERRFRPVDGGPIPEPATEAAAASGGTAVHLFGGRSTPRAIMTFRFDSVGRPSAPRLVQAIPGPDPGQVTLTWQPPAHRDDVEGYRVYRGLGKARPVFVGATDDTVFLDTRLAAGAQFEYQVVAVNEAGEGARADLAVTTPAPPCKPERLLTKPGPAVGQTTLSWASPKCDGGLRIQSYVVYRALPRGDVAMIGSTDLMSFVDQPPRTSGLRYWVAATNEAGVGPKVGPRPGAFPTRPQPPEELQAASTTEAVQLTWSAAASNMALVRYELERAVETHPFERIADALPETREHRDTGCPLARTCHYRVRAVNAVGASEPSPRATGAGFSFFPAAALRADGTALVYNDADRDGRADPGEGLAGTPFGVPLPPKGPIWVR